MPGTIHRILRPRPPRACAPLLRRSAHHGGSLPAQTSPRPTLSHQARLGKYSAHTDANAPVPISHLPASVPDNSVCLESNLPSLTAASLPPVVCALSPGRLYILPFHPFSAPHFASTTLTRSLVRAHSHKSSCCFPSPQPRRSRRSPVRQYRQRFFDHVQTGRRLPGHLWYGRDGLGIIMHPPAADAIPVRDAWLDSSRLVIQGFHHGQLLHRFYGWLLRMFWYVSVLHVPPNSSPHRTTMRSQPARRSRTSVSSGFPFRHMGSNIGQGLGNGRHHAPGCRMRAKPRYFGF